MRRTKVIVAAAGMLAGDDAALAVARMAVGVVGGLLPGADRARLLVPLEDAVVRDVDLLPIVKLHMATHDLMQAHDLRERIVGGHQVAVDQSERHQLHLVVVGDLLFGELDLTAQEDLVWKVQALFFGHAESEVLQLFLQLVQVAIADDLLESVGGHLAFNKDRVPGLEGKVAVVVEVAGAEEFALAVDVQR